MIHHLVNYLAQFVTDGFLVLEQSVGVYSFCDGPRLSHGPYMGITTVCSVLSLVFVSFKASFVFGAPLSGSEQGGGGGYLRASEIALFICSFVLAVGHIVVAYRTSCRERRKLWVYKIDIEAVSPPYHVLNFSVWGHKCHFNWKILETCCERQIRKYLHVHRKYPGKTSPPNFCFYFWYTTHFFIFGDFWCRIENKYY